MNQAQAVREIAQILNEGKVSGQTTRLAKLMGTTVATVRSWGASGKSDNRKRSMNPTAKRLLFVLLALHRDKVAIDELRRKARHLQRQYLSDEEDE